MARLPTLLARRSRDEVRVAIVCPYAWDRPGGVQSHVRSLAQALRGRGHRVRVFAPASRGGTKSSIEPDVTIVGRAIGIRINRSVAPICFGPGAAYRIRRELARFEPDVLHLHEPLIPSLSLLALALDRRPAVGTFHAAAQASRLYGISRSVLNLFFRRLAVTTAVSPAAAALARRYFPRDFVLSPNGIDVAGFAEAERRDLGPGRHVLFLGRLEPRKGAAVAIEATAGIKELGAELLVAGDGGLRSELEHFATRLDVPVRFLGSVSDAEKASLLRSCDAYCAPNLGGESFGIVLLEAMAAGCPVVCSELDAFRWAAADAATFVTAGDAQALAEGLRAVLSDPEGAGESAARGRARAGEFDWKQLLPAVETIYGRALG